MPSSPALPQLRLALQLIVGLLIAASSTRATAGHWSSGGGEILEHASNPWFLQGPTRTEPFRYCVAAGDDFPLPASALEGVVERAFSFWDKQFSNAYLPDNVVTTKAGTTTIKVRINTSQRIREPCSAATDLAFQFGVLLGDQEAEVQRLQIDLTRYVALTIRTDYSDQLRGRGFIYISPDRGPRAFKGQNVIKDVWTQDDSRTQSYRLDSVIAHELGHVFGLSHAATSDSIMSARLAESMVGPQLGSAQSLRVSGIGGAVFFPSGSMFNMDCSDPKSTRTFRDFFAIPDSAACFRVDFNLSRLRIFIRHDRETGQWILVGTAPFTTPSERRHQQLVTLWLPRAQRFYPDIDASTLALLGPAASEVQQTANFVFAKDLTVKPIFIQASPRHMQIGGVGPQGIIPDLLPRSSAGSFSGWSP